nr:hypothetical protein [Saprospiraceae bacterium]
DWQPAGFPIHSQYYVLAGAHATIANDCATCHNGNYNNTPSTCIGCHQADYNGAANPNHVTAGFPTTCDDCHTLTAWTPAAFDHASIWPLTGAHQPIANQCAECHVGGNYTTTPNTCAGCHQPDFNTSTNPNHVTLGLPNDCAQCHTTAPDWMPASFAIHDQFYQLNGAHATIANDCATCHNGNYNNTPNTCVGCHQADYNGTANPNHASAGFPTTCNDCHSESAWTPATFDHNSIWPLTGAHATIANNCAACHIGGNYANTPNTCVGCHQADYNSANNPNHQQAGFPTTCQSCHSVTAWTPANWDHDGMYFPIYSGRHEGEWNQCSECHTTPGNYAVFNCLNCHNNQNELEDDHQDVPAYQYNSNACYSCHPDGSD